MRKRLATNVVFAVFLTIACSRKHSAMPVATNAEPHNLIVDFTAPAEAQAWQIIGDRLMLGRSTGSVEIADGSLVFSGTIRPRPGGGWCSARREIDPPLSLSPETQIILDITTDGKVFGFDLRDNSDFSGTYWEAPVTTSPGLRTSIVLHPSDFVPMRMGSRIESDHAFDWNSIHSIALVIGNRQNGPFEAGLHQIQFQTSPKASGSPQRTTPTS